jgi:hypothetical protein
MVTRGVARIEANGAGVNPVTWVYGSRPRDERFFHSRALIGGGEILRFWHPVKICILTHGASGAVGENGRVKKVVERRSPTEARNRCGQRASATTGFVVLGSLFAKFL